MHILIDMQGMQTEYSQHRGVGRYTVEMVSALIKLNNKKHQITLLFNAALDDTYPNQFLTDLGIHQKEIQVQYWFTYFDDISGFSGNNTARNCAEILREWKIQQIGPDIVWSTNLQEGWFDNAATSVHKLNSNIVYCSTLHDVIPLIYPDIYLSSSIKNWYNTKVTHAELSDIILTVSEHSKNKIEQLTKIERSRIHIAYNSYNRQLFHRNNSFHAPVKSMLYNKINGKEFILYVGGADSHKNLDRLIEAYSRLKPDISDNYILAFASSSVKNQSQHLIKLAKNFGVNTDNLYFIGETTNQELAALMRSCALFVFPSYSEGFGLPPLEAMACGAPVIAANAASIPEIVSNTQALFNPYDVDDIANKITLALTDNNFRQSLIENARKSISKFSWEESASIILDLFEKTLKKIKPRPTVPLALKRDAIIEQLIQVDGIEHINLPKLAKSISNNENQTSNPKRIFLDLSCLVHFDHATGIQRVVRAVMDELYRNPPNGYEILLTFSYTGHSQSYYTTLNDGAFHVPDNNELENHIIDFNKDDVLLFLDLHPGNAISKKEKIIELKKCGVKIFFIVYDLLPISHPHYFVKELPIEFDHWLRVITYSNGAICISQDVATKLDSWIKSNNIIPSYNFRSHYFHLGADIINSKPSKGLPRHSKSLLEKLSLTNSFLMVGTVEPRKGHNLIISAFEILWDKNLDVNLVIVGREGWRNEETIKKIKRHPKANKQLYWLNGISDEFLEKIYANSSALIAASEGEGFGLPLIEAAQYKLPIIARDIPVFHEVAQEHAYYFKDDTPQKVAEDIEKWLHSYKNNTHIKSDKMPWLTWRQSVAQLVDILVTNSKQ